MYTITIESGATIKAPDFKAGDFFANWNTSGTLDDFAAYKVLAVSRVHYLNGIFRFFVYDVEAKYHHDGKTIEDRRFYTEKEFHGILTARHCCRIND
jgi:hypothetical protein